MARKRTASKPRPTPKTVLHLPDLDQAKSAVLNSLSSPEAQRGYRYAMDEFIDYQLVNALYPLLDPRLREQA